MGSHNARDVDRSETTKLVKGERLGGMFVTATAKVTSKGQITVPALVRAQLGIESGDELLFVRAGDRFYIERMPARVGAADLYGILARPGQSPIDVDEMRQKARTLRYQRYVRMGEGDPE